MKPTHNEVEIDDPVVVINIHEQFPHAKTEPELYDCTRGMWRMNPKRAGRAKYFFAVFEGEIKEVYEVHDCFPSTDETREYWRKRQLLQGRQYSAEKDAGRSEFVGEVAPDDVRAKYLGKQLTVKMTQNPIRYFNC
jgi:uncharacterized protein